jgi:hypothetical protein
VSNEASYTILQVRVQTTPKSAAWTRLTVEREAPAGKVTKLPGTSSQNNAAAKRAIFHIFIIQNRKKVFTLFSSSRTYQ